MYPHLPVVLDFGWSLLEVGGEGEGRAGERGGLTVMLVVCCEHT